MIPFLQELAGAIRAEHSEQLREVAVVLPNRRAAVYLRKYLAEAAGKTQWSPQFFTVEEFMQKVAGLRTIGSLDELFELHEVYRAIRPDAAEPLHEFLQWAPVTLRDMSEVDAHLVDHERFYHDLRAIEELEDWSLRYGRDLSPGQLRLTRYWELKRDLHKAFSERLIPRGLGTKGMVERAALDRVQQKGLPWSRVWVAGLNATTTAEAMVLRALRGQGLVRFAWDADHFYLDDPDQEAGRSLRTLIHEHGAGSVPVGNALLVNARSILVARAPNNVAQCHLAAQLIADLSEEERQRTAVVLADESLLMPLLRALPDAVAKVNVTMGMPLPALPVNGLLEALFDLHARSNGRTFHLAQLEAVVMHPFLQRRGEDHTRALIDRLRSEQRTFVGQEDLQRSIEDWPDTDRGWLLGMLKPVVNATSEMPERIVHMIAWAREVMAADVMAIEQFYHLALVIRRIGELLQRRSLELDVHAFIQVVTRCVRQERINFHGEPLEGLQIMGMLETRAIDHERLIVLSAMEGTLPPGDPGNSFIPFDVRRVFGLPLPVDSDAVSAYGFYRSLQRASHVTLITHGGGDRSEETRYIAQLEHELKGHADSTFERQEIIVSSDKAPVLPISVAKDPAVMDRLNKRLERGLSPTAITSFLNCPLDFWFRQVLGLRESESLDERLGDDRVGTSVHATLQEIFTPWVGHELRATDLRSAIAGVPDRIRRSMAQTSSGRSILEGQPLLQAEMATAAVQRYLEQEAQHVTSGDVLHVEALERTLSSALISEVPGVPRSITIKGNLDRVERRNGRQAIIDYKTGGVKRGDTSIRDLASIPPRKPYAVQLLVYAWLALNTDPDLDAVSAGIIPLRNPSIMNEAMLRIGPASQVHRHHLPAIDEFLRSVVSAMLDKDRPFVHDPGSRHCAFCLG